MRKYIWIAWLLLCVPLWATDYYVDTDNGTDQAGCGDTGFGADACKTAQYLDDLYDADITGAASVVVHLKGATDDGLLVVDGWTTDATHTVTYRVDQGDRHAGVFDDSKYNISCTNASCLLVSDEYVRIDGIQISVTESGTSTGRGISVAAIAAGGSDVRLSNNIIRAASMTGTGSAYGISINDAYVTVYAWNNIVYGFISGSDTGFNGISTLNSTSASFYNNTSYGNYYGFSQAAGTMVVTNGLSFGNTDDFNGTITIDYCASDDADGTHAQDLNENASGEWTANTPSYATYNFALGASGLSVGRGTDDPGGAVQENNDIRGSSYPRSSAWDIGAFEYISATAKVNRMTLLGVQ